MSLFVPKITPFVLKIHTFRLASNFLPNINIYIYELIMH